jgi:hypothetical protein
MRKIVFVALAAAVASAAYAQSSARPDPNDPKAQVPGVQYRSAFSEYQSYRDPEIEKWREVNDQVKDLGGHKGHAAKPAAKASAKPEPASEGSAQKPAADPHAGH